MYGEECGCIDRSATIAQGVLFFAVTFAVVANETDPQTEATTKPPSITADGGTLTGDLSAFAAGQAPWDKVADDSIGILRAQAGRDPLDRRLTDLVGELSTRSDEFRVRWAAHNVKLHRTGTKRFHHPVVGDVTVEFDSLDLPGDLGQKLIVYTAEPASPSQQALDLLASGTHTPAAVSTNEVHEDH